MCLYLESDTKLHSVTWGGRYVRPIELLSSELIWQKPAEGNGAACLYNRCRTEMMKGRRSANRGSQSKCSLHSDSWRLIISLIICIIYIELILSCHIHLLWTWVITLWVMSNYTMIMMRNYSILEVCSTFTLFIQYQLFSDFYLSLQIVFYLSHVDSCECLWHICIASVKYNPLQQCAKSYAIRWRWSLTKIPISFFTDIQFD